MQGPQVLVCMGGEDDWYAPEAERVDLWGRGSGAVVSTCMQGWYAPEGERVNLRLAVVRTS